LNVKARIQDVGGGHALVHEARLRSHDLGKVGEKSNDIVLDLAFDCVDARDIEFGRFAFFPDRFCGLFRDQSKLGHGVGGVGFDLEPDAKARLRRPDRRHLWTRIAWDGHAASPRISAAALRIAAMLAR
jgi:hypothetical protein